MTREELLSGIQGVLRGETSDPVAAPKVPGLDLNASAQERAARIAEIRAKPGAHLTQDEVEYLASRTDASILATLGKSTDAISGEEQAALRAAVLKAMQDAAQKGWA